MTAVEALTSLMTISGALLKDWYLWASLILCLVAGKGLSNKYGGHINSVPGPWIAGFTDVWRFTNALFSTPHQTHINLHRTTGSPLVRVGPRAISVSDPSLIPIIYGSKTRYQKTKLYLPFVIPYEGRFMPTLFSTRDEDYHAKIKRPIAQAYSMTALVEFEPLIDSTTDLLILSFNEFAESGQYFDIGIWFQMWAFDVLGELSFGKRLGFLDKKMDVNGIMASIRSQVYLGGSAGQLPSTWELITRNKIFPALMPTHPIVKFVEDRMKERTKALTDRGCERDFLAKCHDAQATSPDVVTDSVIRGYNQDNIIAGSDTTSITLRAMLYYLLKNPMYLARVRDEIDTGAREGCFSWQEASAMPLLNACIKESLRMHPPVGMIMERYVPSGGAVLAGCFLPEGTIVGVNPWVVARNRDTFGLDADSFRPNRWLTGTPEQRASMERANLAFGYGPRSCIGKSLALLSITKLAARLLRDYEFDFKTPRQVWKIQGGFFVPQDNFIITIRRRMRHGKSDGEA